jgi:hypothetical protein
MEQFHAPEARNSFSGGHPTRLNLDPAVAAREAAIGLLTASGCRKSACHPEGDLHRSWKSLAANAEQGGAAA